MMFLYSDMVYILVRYVSPGGPMCLRCLVLTLSGPVEMLFLLCFIASCTCVVESVIVVVCSFYMSVCVVCFMFECVCYLCR